MSRRAGKWERIAVRLNAILRKVPKERSLDGKTWHAETSARRSLMRYIVGVVARLIEEEDERARAAETSDGGADVRPTRITLGGQTVDLKPGETLDIHVKPMDTRTIPVERVIVAPGPGPLIVKRTGPHAGPQVSSCPECGKPILALFDRDVFAAEWLEWHKPGCQFARNAVEESEKLAARTQAPDAGACGWCGKILPASGECPCLPF